MQPNDPRTRAIAKVLRGRLRLPLHGRLLYEVVPTGQPAPGQGRAAWYGAGASGTGVRLTSLGSVMDRHPLRRLER